jgi:hypothetical protein
MRTHIAVAFLILTVVNEAYREGGCKGTGHSCVCCRR